MLVKTQHLILRQFIDNDYDITKIYEYSQEDSMKKGIPNQVYSDINEAAETIRYLIDRYNGNQLPHVLAIELIDIKDLIGHIGISDFGGGVEIGYAIGEHYQNKGYAVEAVTAFCEYVFNNFDYIEIWGIVNVDNTASRRVLEKSEFIYIESNEEKIKYKLCQYDIGNSGFSNIAFKLRGIDSHV